MTAPGTRGSSSAAGTTCAGRTTARSVGGEGRGETPGLRANAGRRRRRRSRTNPLFPAHTKNRKFCVLCVSFTDRARRFKTPAADYSWIVQLSGCENPHSFEMLSSELEHLNPTILDPTLLINPQITKKHGLHKIRWYSRIPLCCSSLWVGKAPNQVRDGSKHSVQNAVFLWPRFLAATIVRRNSSTGKERYREWRHVHRLSIRNPSLPTSMTPEVCPQFCAMPTIVVSWKILPLHMWTTLRIVEPVVVVRMEGLREKLRVHSAHIEGVEG